LNLKKKRLVGWWDFELKSWQLELNVENFAQKTNLVMEFP